MNTKEEGKKGDDGGALNRSKVRWAMLRKVLAPKLHAAKGANDESGLMKSVSVRRHLGFGLIPQNEVPFDLARDDKRYTKVEYKIEGKTVLLRLRRADSITTEDLHRARESGVDNTGNVCLWPSEEVLAHYITAPTNGESVLAKLSEGVVCELGAATDGNPDAVENLKHNVASNENHGTIPTGKVVCDVLQWHQDHCSEYSGKCDLVVGADCLFFKDFHYDLINTIDRLLRPAGTGATCLMLAPGRGGTMKLFLERAKERGMEFEVREHYDDAVSRADEAARKDQSNTEYDPDLHYPMLLVYKR